MQRNKIYLLAEKKKRGFYNPRFRLGFQSVFSFLPDINIHAQKNVEFSVFLVQYDLVFTS